ncbi:MAG: MarC family protein [Trueperaceae bacterium]|nr:MarC family protein [Trueperaceae bacterium]
MEFGGNVWSAATVLLFVMDPFGNVPLVLKLLEQVDPARRRRVIARELLIALGVLLAFLFTGQAILDFLGLQRESVTIAGGIVLGIIGLRLIFPRPEGIMGHQPEGEPFLVPLAIPLIAGPSAMATVILMSRNAPDEMGRWVAAIGLAWGITAGVLLASPALYRLLRERGLQAIARLMGMLLIMIAVQMVLNGLGSAL